MPFKSQAQAGYLHSHPEILGAAGLREWDAATKGKHLPKHVKKFHNGTDYVPHDMLAHLDKGEAVIPKKDNPMASDFRGEFFKKDHKPPKHIKRMIHEKTDNNKHLVTHEHHHPEHYRDEKHSFDNFSDVLDHMQKHAGDVNDGETPETGANAPAPMTAAPPAMPAAGADAGAATPGA